MKYFLLFFIAFYLSPAKSQTYITKNIKSFGAKGDGKTNDNDAFQAAAAFFNQRGGNGKLIIPKGIYIVGKQNFTGGQKNKPAYYAEDLMHFTNVKNLSIYGAKGSVLKYISGLHFGTFSPSTGDSSTNGNNFFNYSYAAVIGFCIFVSNSSNITISGLTLDGNSDHFILGGIYGDVGRQLPHSGIFISNCKNIKVDKIYAHHFGLDGVCVQNKETNSPDSITIINSTFEYNARQGLSWVGGNDLYVKNCKFNHTGKGTLRSAPGAGVDIEAEAGPNRNGVFESCEFIDNTGCGLVADSGNSAGCIFKNCTFWGSTSWSIWVTKPAFSFYNCNIYGSIVHGFSADNDHDATKFYNCHFEDKPYNGLPPYGKFLVESNNVRRMSFKNCVFITNTKKICWFQSSAGLTSDEKYQLINCTFTINNNNLPAHDFIGITRGVVAKNCTFNFTSPDAKEKAYNFGDTNPLTNPGSSGNRILYQGK